MHDKSDPSAATGVHGHADSPISSRNDSPNVVRNNIHSHDSPIHVHPHVHGQSVLNRSSSPPNVSNNNNNNNITSTSTSTTTTTTTTTTTHSLNNLTTSAPATAFNPIVSNLSKEVTKERSFSGGNTSSRSRNSSSPVNHYGRHSSLEPPMFSPLPPSVSDISQNSTGGPTSGPKVMTAEEEAELELLRQARGRSNAFYRPPSLSSSPLTRKISTNPKLPKLSSSALVDIRKPLPPLEHVLSVSTRFDIGYAETIGLRNAMEDEILIRGKFRGKEDEDFIAIFDGHGGDAASKFANQHLHKILETKMNQMTAPTTVEDCLRAAFVETHEQMRVAQIKGGTTALVALIIRDKLYIANAGDSRSVLCLNENKTLRLSRDHKPGEASEHKRIEALGGHVTTTIDMWGNIISRVKGQLSVSRALGDFPLAPFVIPDPEVQVIDLNIPPSQPLLQLSSSSSQHGLPLPLPSLLRASDSSNQLTNSGNNCDNNSGGGSPLSNSGNNTPNNTPVVVGSTTFHSNPFGPAKFVILACDGLWDILSDHDAVSIANSSSNSDPESICQKLRDYAYSEGSKDNISV